MASSPETTVCNMAIGSECCGRIPCIHPAPTYSAISPPDPFRGARPWAARVRRGPSGEVILAIGGSDLVMAEDQADRLSVLLREVSMGHTDDTGVKQL